MEKTVTYYKEMAQNVRYGVEKESNILIDRLAQMDEYKEMAECVEELLAEVQRLKGENKEQSRKHAEEMEALRQQLAEEMEAQRREMEAKLETEKQKTATERQKRAEKEMNLNEVNKLMTEMVKKATAENLLSLLRKYAGNSKRKTMDRRSFAKTTFWELANMGGLTIPTDLAETVEHLDDERPVAREVNVQGNYVDVHDNGEVRGRG